MLAKIMKALVAVALGSWILSLLLFIVDAYLHVPVLNTLATCTCVLGGVLIGLLLFICAIAVPVFIVTGFLDVMKAKKKWPAAEISDDTWGRLRREAGESHWEGCREHPTFAALDISLKDPGNFLPAMNNFWQELERHDQAAQNHLRAKNEELRGPWELTGISQGVDPLTVELSYSHPDDEYGGWDVIFLDGEIKGSVYGD
jgi:hypothetical protein